MPKAPKAMGKKIDYKDILTEALMEKYLYT
jgi:hypothetical protein